jgi:hypothetical protein
MKKYSHSNWNKVLSLPDGPNKDMQLMIIGDLAKGNLAWFVRRMIAMDVDIKLVIENPSWEWRLIEPTQFTKYRRKIENENSVRKD